MKLFIPSPIRRHVATHLDQVPSSANQVRYILRGERKIDIAPTANMKNISLGQVIGISVGSSKTYAEDHLPSISLSQSASVTSIKERKWPSLKWMKKFRKSSEHLSTGNKHEAFNCRNSSDTAKRDLSLGESIPHAHNADERLFRRSFSVDQDERFVMGYHCYLYTTAGPIKGILFMSTKKIAFSSDKPLSFSSPKGETVKVPYKVLIPVLKIKDITPAKNLYKPGENYIHIVTVDDFEFWFSGAGKQKRSESLPEAL